jgi:hypothetical protein
VVVSGKCSLKATCVMEPERQLYLKMHCLLLREKAIAFFC